MLGAAILTACGGGNDGDAPPTNEQALGASSCATRPNDTQAKLLECVTLAGAREHLVALQQIADANGGTRFSGSPGYDQSVQYAMTVFAKAGFAVTKQEFQFRIFEVLSPSVLDMIAPLAQAGLPHNIMSYSGSGDVTAPVAVPSGSPLGCDPNDFAGFPAGSIALIGRGTPAGFPVACTFGLKATNAHAAGAAAVIVYNNTDGPLNGTLGTTFALPVPAIGITMALGQELLALMPAGLTMRVKTDTLRETRTTSNVLAESAGGDPNNVVMVGAHLDSVDEGPGINDNGTGAAAILETARQMAKVKPRNKLRFALWGAEEASLVGSTFYVNSLAAADRARIALYLNFDMIGSPNYGLFIYDGDNSDNVGAGPGPQGSAQIEKVFEGFYTSRNKPFRGTDFSGRSDYGPFIAIGIPSGGLFTGAEVPKTAEQVGLWGGSAGIAFDPCYHQACDTIDNVSDVAFELNTDAVAYATLRFAMNTSDVNGVKAKGNFKVPQLPGHEDLQ